MQSFLIPLLTCCINPFKARLLYWINTSRGGKKLEKPWDAFSRDALQRDAFSLDAFKRDAFSRDTLKCDAFSRDAF